MNNRIEIGTTPPTEPTPGPPSPWAAPDPSTRAAAPLGASMPSGRRRAVRSVVSLGIAGALIGGVAAYAAIGVGRGSRVAAPTTAVTRPVPSSIATAPATAPAGTTPTSGSAGPATTVPTRPSVAPPTSTPATVPSRRTTPTTAEQQQAAVTASLSAGVVDIYTVLGYQNAEAAGTGIILTADGEILTNNHVIAGSTVIKVVVVTTGKSYTAKVVGTDAADDIAVVQLTGASGLVPAHLGDSSKVQVDDPVVAVGNAGGQGGTPTTATGKVTALDQQIVASDENGSNQEQLQGLIQIDARLQAGESGGPLYNGAGEVIGIDTAGEAFRRFSGRGGVGFAIPINTALAIANDIEQGKTSASIVLGTPGFLGVATSDATAPDGSTGLVITEVVAGTPAARIGLQTNDIITAIDGVAVESTEGLAATLHGHHGGDKVSVAWTGNDGQPHSATVTLAEGPAA